MKAKYIQLKRFLIKFRAHRQVHPPSHQILCYLYCYVRVFWPRPLNDGVINNLELFLFVRSFRYSPRRCDLSRYGVPIKLTTSNFLSSFINFLKLFFYGKRNWNQNKNLQLPCTLFGNLGFENFKGPWISVSKRSLHPITTSPWCFIQCINSKYSLFHSSLSTCINYY